MFQIFQKLRGEERKRRERREGGREVQGYREKEKKKRRKGIREKK